MRFASPASGLDRYFFRQLFWALIAVTAGLTVLIWLTQASRFVELTVNRGHSLLVFVRLTGLLIPSVIAVILPITTYVVIQYIYQRLVGDRWVTIMRTTSLSPSALVRLVAPDSILTGAFQRHRRFACPLIAVAAVVPLVALALTIDGLTARDNTLIPLIWVRALLPGVVCAIWPFLPMPARLTTLWSPPCAMDLEATA